MISFLRTVAHEIIHLEMFPIFIFAHDYLAAAEVRKAFGAYYPRRSALSFCISWLVTMFCAFAGDNIVYFLLELDPIAGMRRMEYNLLATAVWFAVSFSPNDVFYYIGELLPVQIFVNTLKEIYRAERIWIIISPVLHRFPDSWMITSILYAIVMGTITGNGEGIFKEFRQLALKTLSPRQTVKISLTTKLCFLASIIYIMEKKKFLIPFSFDLVHLGVVLLFIIAKISTLLNSWGKNFNRR